MKLNWRLLLLPVAVVVEVASVALSGLECGLGGWVLNRHLGEPLGRPWERRGPS